MAISYYDVQRAYLAYFGRPGDPVGVAAWMTSDAATMRAGFAASAEYTALYSGLTTDQRVDQLYQNLLGRPAEAAGKAYWVNQIDSGLQTVGTLAQAILDGAQGSDAMTVLHRVAYALMFTEAVDTPAEIAGYSGNTAAGLARLAMSTIDSTAASLTTAEAFLNIDVASVVAGLSPIAARANDAIAIAASQFSLTESGTTVTLSGSSTDAFVDTLGAAVGAAGAPTRAGFAVDVSSGTLQVTDANFNGSTYVGNETITGSSSANTITTGPGADTITGGAGVDTINVGTGSIDTVVITAVTTAADRDVIIGFVSGTDKLTIGSANTTAATGAGAAVVMADTSVASTGGGAYALTGATTAATAVILLHTTGAVTPVGVNSGNLSAATDGTELLKALTDATAADTYTGITAAAAGNKAYLVASQGGNTYVYLASDANSDGLIVASEISLVGTFTGTPAMVAADFVLA